MAFDPKLLDPTGSGSKGVAKLVTYGPSTDNKATVAGAGYFNSYHSVFRTGDVLFAQCSDGLRIFSVAVAAGVVTLTAYTL